MYKLLVESKMDGFSIVDARNASIGIPSVPTDLDESRKQIYRQILRFEKNGWLKSVGVGRGKKYFITDKFKGLNFKPKYRPEQVHVIQDCSEDMHVVLSNEFKMYEEQHKITLKELDEYQNLVERFPELKAQLTPMLETTKARLNSLVAKVNVFSQVMNAIS